MKQSDAQKHPFTAAGSYSPTVAKMHHLVSNFARLDARLNTPKSAAGKRTGPYVNFFDKDKEFLCGAAKLPTYGPLFWLMFTEVLKGWGAFGRRLLAISTPGEVDDIMDETVEMYALPAPTFASLYSCCALT
jgi:hypothetical protein